MSSFHHGNLRAALLEAAELELSQKGIEALSLRQVAKRAGVSHAAPAKHFKNANDLLTALAARSFQKHLALIEGALDKCDGTTTKRLVAGGLAYVAYATDHANMFDLQFNSKRPDRNDPDLAKAGGAAFAIVLSEVGQAYPNLSESDIFDRSTAFWIFLHGAACLAANDVLGRLEVSRPEGASPVGAGSAEFFENLIRSEVARLSK